jgi:hypothetical protein
VNNFTTHYFDDNTTAAQILNADFYSPEVVQDAFGWRYSEDQLLRFATSIPDMRTLRKLQSNGFMLMARPPFALSSAGIFDTNLGLFCGAVSPHPFLKTDVVRAGGWLMLRKEAHPLTYGLTTPEQCQKLFLPRAYG